MLKKFTLGIVCLGLSAVALHAAAPAGDNAANYGSTANWTVGSNLGFGFAAWGITDGDGGHYIGGTGLGANTFGLFNTFSTTTTEVFRGLTGGALSAGQTFSIDLGFTPFVANQTAGASVGIDLRSGGTTVIELQTNGAGNWTLNDGGSNFSAGAVATANTPYHFSFTFNGGSSYSFTLTGSPGGSNFTATSGLIGNIDNIRLFNFNQGAGANFGFDNLAVVPEPTTLSLLAGPAILGAWFFVRRRRP